MMRYNRVMTNAGQGRGRLGAWWFSYSAGQRTLAVGLWIASAGLSIFGLYGDERGWWVTRPFATNLVSSAAGACFGVPIAIFVLQTLASRQSDLSERRRSIQVAARNATDLVTAAALPARLPDGPEGQEWLTAFIGAARDLERRCARSESATADGLDDCADLAGMVSDLVDVGMMPMEITDAAIAQVQLKWQILQGDVRERLADNGIGWISLGEADPFVRALNDARAVDTGLLSAAGWREISERLRSAARDLRGPVPVDPHELRELVTLAGRRAAAAVPSFMTLVGLGITARELEAQLTRAMAG
jgi:hypothetical protein